MREPYQISMQAEKGLCVSAEGHNDKIVIMAHAVATASVPTLLPLFVTTTILSSGSQVTVGYFAAISNSGAKVGS